jgi:hypothetical protein
MSDALASNEGTNAPDGRGTVVDNVPVLIDYAIVTHFSDHLYGSPNKAVEELVANSYDAWAKESRVFLPGEYSKLALLVWDDGESMDIEGIHALWWIAKSPKLDEHDRIQTRASRRKRALIGKFGIGKLASYSLGYRVTHLCRRGTDFFRISVDYRTVPSISEGDREIRFETPLIKLSESEAEEYVSSLFSTKPGSYSSIWVKPSWTIAIVDELKPEKTIHAGRLRWILGNGMPLRPDFKVYVNEVRVKPHVETGAFCDWDLSEPRLQQQLLSDWESAKADGKVFGDITFKTSGTPAKTVAVFPKLGAVAVTVKLFGESLIKGRSTDIDRSHGFFIMVRDRLLNPEDDKLFLHEPSFGTFYRSHFHVEADGLDAELLADRERVQSESPMAKELEILQRSLYLVARQELQARDTELELHRRSESLLPIQSRDHFTDPMIALLLSRGQDLTLDPNSATIRREPLTVEEPLVILSEEGFSVNINHPFFHTLSDRLGSNAVAREALRAFDVLAVADLLLAGHLFDIGIAPEQIDEVLNWRDGLLRSVANRLSNASDDLVSKAREASYEGDKPFEIALARMFESVGFTTQHDGQSGKKDVLVVAPIGENAFRFTVEAKGSTNAISNSDADISNAAAHLNGTGADIAVVVAREFAGFERPGTRPMVLQECDATEGKVAIASLDVCIAIYEAMMKYAYPLDAVLSILKDVESPAQKLLRVETLLRPTEGFDFPGVLGAIWDLQNNAAYGDQVSYRQIWQSRSDWRAMDFRDFARRLMALQVLSGALILVSETRETVTMKQSPQHIVAAIRYSLVNPKTLN